MYIHTSYMYILRVIIIIIIMYMLRAYRERPDMVELLLPGAFGIFVGDVFTRAIVCTAPPSSFRPSSNQPCHHHFTGNDATAAVVFVCIFYCSLE